MAAEALWEEGEGGFIFLKMNVLAHSLLEGRIRINDYGNNSLSLACN